MELDGSGGVRGRGRDYYDGMGWDETGRMVLPMPIEGMVVGGRR